MADYWITLFHSAFTSRSLPMFLSQVWLRTLPMSRVRFVVSTSPNVDYRTICDDTISNRKPCLQDGGIAVAQLRDGMVGRKAIG